MKTDTKSELVCPECTIAHCIHCKCYMCMRIPVVPNSESEKTKDLEERIEALEDKLHRLIRWIENGPEI